MGNFFHLLKASPKKFYYFSIISATNVIQTSKRTQDLEILKLTFSFQNPALFLKHISLSFFSFFSLFQSLQVRIAQTS